jgi:hypothetical protein
MSKYNSATHILYRSDFAVPGLFDYICEAHGIELFEVVDGVSFRRVIESITLDASVLYVESSRSS